METNSKSVNPSFYSNSNLHSFSPFLYLGGSPIAGITDDIDGETRHATTPCIGADEYILLNNNAAVTSMTSPDVVICGGGIKNVSVVLKNTGPNVLTSASLGWKVNGLAQTV
jgi:hypothetical protein